jgi:serine/threonine protein kinase
VKTGLYFMPSSLSEDTQDLIKRMLVVDPEKRITMEEIKNHKWFKSNSNQLPEPFPVQIAHLTDPDDIDPEIIANLMTLGWETENDLIQAILSPEDNVEKVFYQFLYERKCDFLENGDDDDSSSEINPAGPRRRADSFSAEFKERRSSNASSPSRIRSQSPDPKGSPTNKPLTVDIPNAAMNLMSLNNQKGKKDNLPESPAGSTPKRSWFANLFNFKGAVIFSHFSFKNPKTNK